MVESDSSIMRVAVLGLGTMGCGIVQVFANDLATFLVDASSGAGGLNVPMAVIRTD